MTIGKFTQVFTMHPNSNCHGCHKTQLVLFFGLMISICALDLASKYSVQKTLQIRESYSLIPQWLEIIHLPELNQGTLWSLGREYGNTTNLILAILNVCISLGIIVWMIRPQCYKDRWLTFALGIVLGGAAGNLYDRFTFGGVRDFIHMFHRNAEGVLVWDYPVYNIADCAVVCGMVMLVIHAIFMSPKPSKAATTK